MRSLLNIMSLRAKRSNLLARWDCFVAVLLAMTMLASCAPVDLNAPMPVFDTRIDPDTWAQIPAGEFYFGQHEDVETTDAYEIMITDVTTAQYADFLNAALADGYVQLDGEQLVGFYPGDEFRGVKHEEKIEAGEWIFIPLNDPSQRVKFNGTSFTVQPGYENHPMTMVSWFGAWGYCGYYDWRLPTELEWEKAGRGADERPFPWGDEIARENANFYSSRDPFEDMSSFGSRTSPVGFYNGQKYGDYQTLASASPYGLYDMAGNVWQWTGDVYDGMHYRFMRGGSKDTYDMDLRLWVRNNATPTYYSPGVGFRCAR
ncbi:MAG: formylglycine-generating enzyme family protein [Anaerolineae bacterium]|nr:formylglycine-generating enzyme family protein [Anaerolineae bacterium]